MLTSALKSACRFFIPGGVLIAAAVSLWHLPGPRASVDPFLPYLPPLVYGVGLLLGWRFNRSRLVFAVLVLAMADQALHLSTSGAARQVISEAVCLLLPLNLGVLSLLQERGILTRWGWFRIVLICSQPAALVWLFQRYPGELLLWLERPLFPLPPVLGGMPLSHPGMAGGMLALLFFRFLHRPRALECGFFWSLVALIPALSPEMDDAARSLYFALSGSILIASLIEASYGMAFQDELTGLPARRALNETFQKLGHRYAVAMVDIDHFKKVNDRHGHDVGDQVLKMVASKLARVSGGGKAFRYGGEEFAILFPGRRAEEVKEHLEKLRVEVAESGFTLRHRSRPRKKPQGKVAKKGTRQLTVTVSIGLAERSGRLRRPDQVLKAADQALYKAKKGGRDRVCGEGNI